MDNHNFIANIRKKNKRALEFVVDHYSNLVCKVIRSVLPANDCEALVEECMNDVFWLVWCNIDSFDETKGDFKSWIAAISKYKAIDCRRKLYKQSQWVSFNDGNVYEEISTEEIVVTKENRKELMKAISEMKADDREIFIRRYFLGEGIGIGPFTGSILFEKQRASRTTLPSFLTFRVYPKMSRLVWSLKIRRLKLPKP